MSFLYMLLYMLYIYIYIMKHQYISINKCVMPPSVSHLQGQTVHALTGPLQSNGEEIFV